MYKLNLKNPVVNKFIDYYWAVVGAVVRRDDKIVEEESQHHTPLTGAVPVSSRNV